MHEDLYMAHFLFLWRQSIKGFCPIAMLVLLNTLKSVHTQICGRVLHFILYVLF